ncbi:aminotransferase class IV [uncultured Clostridium sp.]|uniref:aminotransferase class IV n=1 Tax=uncultured Clostridium sp. TaxID=59620 RepID=UPI0025D33E93|nr:aminotransferase class IV [uncultured Clostridium sp.]
MKVVFDEGYSFGLGIFETMSVIDNHVVLLDYHMQRLEEGMKKLSINVKLTKDEIVNYAKDNPMKDGVIKVIISHKNIIWQCRDNNYTDEKYKKGFSVCMSSVIRNETSLFTYIKSLNYGDNIIEKRLAVQKGYDEPIFLNSKGQLTEGAVSNIFFIKDDVIFTPNLSCGMLNGTIRRYIVDKYEVVEKVIYPEEVVDFDEMFLSNSLMGIMPVHSFEGHKFKTREKCDYILKKYLDERTCL